MSNRYKGGVISATPPTTSGGESGTASGAWTLEQQMQLQAAGLWPAQPTGPWIEDCFSTYLYTGNGSTQTITNGIDLSTKGGLVWIKNRNGTYFNTLFDTVRGTSQALYTNTTDAQTGTSGVTAFNTTGFTLGAGANTNAAGFTFASWTFREQPKFFDVVTLNYTSGAAVFNHSLGSVPGFVILKVSSGYADNWWVYHRSLGNDQYVNLNLTSAAQTSTGIFSATDTTFTVKNGIFGASTIVAYLFAHNAGGFGLTGTDNVISCGSFTTDGSGNATVSLGYEPQWLMYKCSSAVGDWEMVDVMRGWVVGVNNDNGLRANSSDAESTGSNRGEPSSTGFNCVSFPTSRDFIYIAIRRGPMKVPTSGTSVFSPVAQTKSSFPSTVTAGFPVDLTIEANRASDGLNSTAIDRLRGGSVASITSGTAAEYGSAGCSFASNTVFSDGWLNNTSNIYWMFRRAPSFFDEVCYTGTGSARTVTHNLGVVPELMIVKRRSGAANWPVYSAASGNTKYQYLNSTLQADTFNMWNNTTPTASVFSISGDTDVNGSGSTYVAYLFATCAGVSKVGSYTGTGAAQTINCGFTAGSRFVMIKRTDSTGDWYVWDSARGIIPSNDPYLLLNSTAAEVTGTDYVDTTNVGFDITSTAPSAINANGGTFIFLAIA